MTATTTESRVIELTDQLLADLPPASTPAVEFLGAQFDRGLAWVHFAEGDGGLGVPPKLQEQVSSRLRAARAPVAGLRNPIGFGMGADRRHPRQRGPASPLPPPAVHGRGGLVPALQRAGRRLRRGRPGDAGGA